MKKRFDKPKKDSYDSDNPSANVKGFVRKIGNYFNTEPQKEKVLQHEDFNAAGDVYYATVSANYKVAQRILTLFLVFFLIFSIITNFNEITYDNLFYLLKDFTSAADLGNNYYETLSYESDSRQNFVLYRGGIASVSPSRISIFTATGRRTLNDTSEFSSPYAISSDKYVLFYDTAGTTFSIYNSFTRVYLGKSDYPIKCASLAKDGSFAIVTKADTGFWNVKIYTKNFKLKAIIESENYIFGIDLNSDLQKLSVIKYDSGEGIGRTTLSIYDLSKMTDKKGNEVEEQKIFIYEGEFPIKAGFIGDDSIALITDRYVRIYDSSCNEHTRSNDYSNGNITGYYLGKEGVAVSVMNSANCKIMAYDRHGNELCEKKVSYNISDISIYDTSIFLQVNSSVIKISSENDNIQELNVGNGKMLVYNENTVLVCGESKAEYLIFDK